jgi:pimeloyl-ACP methyl ester carboxylesterase
VLVMHGERDAVVPISFGEQLFGLIQASKQFVRFPEGGHSNLDGFGAVEAVHAFLNKL